MAVSATEWNVSIFVRSEEKVEYGHTSGLEVQLTIHSSSSAQPLYLAMKIG